MKATVKQYAKSLYEATKGKSQKEIDLVLENFVKTLSKNNQLKLKNRIVEEFSETYNRENGIVEARVVSREKLSGELLDRLIGFVKEKYGAKEVSVENKIDDKIKGGVIVRVGDEVMDGSVARRLRELKESLSR